MKHLLPDLNYPYHALEPYIDELTMKIHHTKHHQAYVDNLNTALDKYPSHYEKDLKELLLNLEKLPEDIRTAVRNNGGGHYNHSFFWQLLKPNNQKLPDNQVAKAIIKTYGSWDNFFDQFKKAALGRFGSGWAWLIKDVDGQLKIMSTPNQDVPLDQGQLLLALDVWEHAYYLNYQNRRADYINAFFKIIDWDKVNELYQQ